MLESVLIANRGEIAGRIARSCRDLGIRSIGVYTADDDRGDHLRRCDEVVELPHRDDARTPYLDIDAVVDAAGRAGAQAVHPGYGFLAENADLAAAVVDAGLVFVGPPASAMRLLGDKRAARDAALSAGLPTLPSYPVTSTPDDVEFPVVVKAAFGGGGRGMRIVTSSGSLADAVAAAESESTTAFGRGELLIERFVPRARHIEVQLIADLNGNVVAVGTRDCTIQRRHQKLLEEAPAPGLPDEVLEQITRGSVRLLRDVGYVSCATVEFLFDPDSGSAYFLEVNTRIQVEHTVTEMVTGVDLVAAQLLIASDAEVPWMTEPVITTGHAIQARINAEDPTFGFAPSTGTLSTATWPSGPWVRCDVGASAGTKVTARFDSLLGKVCVWGPDRASARARLRRALVEVEIEGVETTTAYIGAVLDNEHFVGCEHWTRLVDEGVIVPPVREPRSPEPLDADVTEGIVRFRTTIGGLLQIAVPVTPSVTREDVVPDHAGSSVGFELMDARGPTAPMDCTLIAHLVAVGERVEAGATVAVVESMKMEIHLTAEFSGVVVQLRHERGQPVRRGEIVVDIEADAS